MAKGLLDGVNVKKLGIGIVASWVYIFVTDFVIHGMILKDLYKRTASLWRPDAEMQSMMPAMSAGQFLMAATFMFIFTKGYQKGGVSEGVRFGLVFWVLILSSYLMQYATTPLTQEVVVAWAATSLVQLVFGGVVAALVYKK